MKLSVIVLNYNVKHFLELCLHSVRKSIAHIDAEVIVVDNNSSDKSVAMVAEYFPEMRLIANKENLGFSKAYNQAVEEAKGEYICVLNPDTVVCEYTFLNCLKKAEELPNLGILGVQLIDGRGRFLPESKRNLPTAKVSFFKVFGGYFSRIAPYYADHIEKDDEGMVEILVGAFMLLKKAIYQEAKGFDERYFMYGEDIDFSYSVQQLGYQNHYLGTERVVHFKGESTIKDKVYRERFFGAMKLFYKKYFKYTWLTDIVISRGIKLSAYLHSIKKEEVQPNFKQIECIGTDSIKNTVLKRVKIEGEINIESTTKLILLDTRTKTYDTLFSYLLDDLKSYYRFVLPYTDKCVGSDTSSGRGEVVSF